MEALCSSIKQAILSWHLKAERSAFQQEFIRGNLQQYHYALYLRQMLEIHQTLEDKLIKLNHQPLFAKLLQPYQYQTPYLREDLLQLRYDYKKIAILPSTEQMILPMSKANVTHEAYWLIGCHYTLEGSKNGSKYIARIIQKKWNLEWPTGTRYLDPYGEMQPTCWQHFKNSLDALPCAEQNLQQMIFGAQYSFDGLVKINEELAGYLETIAPAPSIDEGLMNTPDVDR